MSGPLRIPREPAPEPPQGPGPSGPDPGWRRHWLLLALTGGGVIVVVALLLTFNLGRGQVSGLNREITSLRGKVDALETPPPQPTVATCTSASTWLTTITTQEKASQWDIAAANARAALAAPGICTSDKSTLAQKAVGDDLEGLFSAPFSPDPKAQQLALDRYQGTKRFAERYGVPLPSARQVAGRAYGNGQFLLAKTAFEEALESGEISTTDQAQVQFYISTLHNLGKWWAAHGTGETRTAGLQLLAASSCLDRKYRVGGGEAWGALRELLGPDETHWPPPATTPLLRAGESCDPTRS